MATPTVTRKPISPAFWVAGILAVILLIAAYWYLSRPALNPNQQRPSADALSYLPQLQITDETVKAADNLMRQQVVYIDGKITNRGSRSITRLDVYCIFKDVNGREIYRERSSIVAPKPGSAFGPGQTRSFELPFDNLPDGWNQGLPNLVIAQINFAK